MLSDKTPNDPDQLVDEALKSEPGYTLPDNFAAMVAERVGRRFAWEQYFKEFLVYLGAIAGIGVVSAVMALIWFEADWNEWLGFVVSNAALVAGINFLVVFVLFIDRVVLRYFMFRSSNNRPRASGI